MLSVHGISLRQIWLISLQMHISVHSITAVCQHYLSTSYLYPLLCSDEDLISPWVLVKFQLKLSGPMTLAFFVLSGVYAA